MSIGAAGTIAGIVVAIVYVLSPTTVWLGVAMVPLFALAGRGLPREERRWVWSLLACALALRVLTVLGLLLFADNQQSDFTSFFFDEDGKASKLRSTWIRNVWLGLPIEPYVYSAFARDYGWTSYLNVLAYLQYLLGRAPYGIHLMNIGIFLSAAVVLYRLARRSYGPFAACTGFGLLLFCPTIFLWSVSAMKESLLYLLIAALLISVIEALRGGPWMRRVFAAGTSVVAFAALITVKRDYAMLFLAAIVMGAAAAFVIRRRNLLIACPVIVAVGVWSAFQQDAIRERATSVLARAVSLHIGHVHTRGHTFKLLDERFYWSFGLPDSDNSMTPAQTARFVLRGLASFVLVPLPWQAFSWAQIIFVPAQVFWYCLLFLAAAGFVTALRRDALVTSVLISGCAIPAAAIAITEGNFGTIVRHRDSVTPFIVWISGVGAAQGLAWLANLVPASFGSDRVALTAPVRSSIPSHRPERHLSPRSTFGRTSVVCQLFVPIAKKSKESRVCRSVVTFVSRRTRGIDLGVPHAEEAVALRRLAILARDSRLFTLVRCATTAWSEARTVHAINRRLSEWSSAQRVRLLGWAITVALAVEMLFISIDISTDTPDVSVLGWGIRAALLTLGSVFVTTGQPVAAAWREWRLRTMSCRPSGDAGRLQTTVLLPSA